MTVQVVGAAAGAFDAGLLMDVMESWNGLHFGQSNSPQTIPFEFLSRSTPNQPDAAPFFPALTGVGSSLAYDATVGRIVHNWSSAAAVQGLSAQTTNAMGFPFVLRFALADSIPIGLLPPLRSYRIDYVARVTVAGAAGVVCGVGYDSPAILANNNPGCIWRSDPAINGGRWTPQYRLATAAAVLNGTDSGVSSVAWHQLSIRFTEGLVPLIEWMIDERTVFSLAGDANIPNPIAGSFSSYPSKGLAAGVGTTAQFAPTRMRVQEIGR